MTVRRIFHPTDFSPSADVALRFALQLAVRLDTELYIGHVLYGGRSYWDADAAPSPEDIDVETRLRESLVHRLQQMPHDHVDRMRPTYHVIRHEAPARGIISFAEQHDVDVIVLGMHGRRGIRRLLLGSVAFEVLHSAQTDVIVVPDHYAEDRGGRILVPLDLYERSGEVVAAAGKMSSILNTPLDLMHVLDLPESLQMRPDPSLRPDMSNLRQVVEERLDMLTEVMDPGVIVTLHVETGRPAGTIVKYVNEHSVRFVVMASAGMSPAERIRRDPGEGNDSKDLRWAIGRVTERVVSHSAVPVWVVKRFADRVPEMVEHYDIESESIRLR